MNEHLRRAVDALERGASELRSSAPSPHRVRSRLRQTVEEVLDHLEADASDPGQEDIVSSLDRQAQNIAEDLRRAERLMRERMGHKPNDPR